MSNNLAYLGIVSLNIILGLTLSKLTDKTTNFIGDYFELGFYKKIFFQVILVAIIIFVVKQLSKIIPKLQSKESYSYDMIFISIYLSSQGNFRKALKRFSDNYSIL